VIAFRNSFSRGNAATVTALLAAWTLFSALWIGLHLEYPLHIPLVPWPGTGSLSRNGAAFLFLAPLALAMAGLVQARFGARYARVARVAAWCLSVLLFLAAALIGLALAG